MSAADHLGDALDILKEELRANELRIGNEVLSHLDAAGLGHYVRTAVLAGAQATEPDPPPKPETGTGRPLEMDPAWAERRAKEIAGKVRMVPARRKLVAQLARGPVQRERVARFANAIRSMRKAGLIVEGGRTDPVELTQLGKAWARLHGVIVAS